MISIRTGEDTKIRAWGAIRPIGAGPRAQLNPSDRTRLSFVNRATTRCNKRGKTATFPPPFLRLFTHVCVQSLGPGQRLLSQSKYLVSPDEKLFSFLGDHVTHKKVILKIKSSTHEHIIEAAVEGAVLRLRPVMMTMLVATLGLLPAALSHAIGSDSQRPFAIVIVGGLLANLVIGVFLLPTLYVWVAREDDVLPPSEANEDF